MDVSEDVVAVGVEGHDGEKAPIVFGLAPPPKQLSALDEEREKHKKRAERFAMTYIDPAGPAAAGQAARKPRLQPAVTGIDPFTQEEVVKRSARAARFNIAPVLQYKLDPDEEAKIRRAHKFAKPYAPAEAALMDVDLYEARKEVGRDVVRRPEAIYVYGVDLLSSKELLAHFSEFGPTWVERINDSSCNIVFPDAISAKRAIVGMGVPLPPDVVPGAEDSAVIDPADEAATIANMPYFWHKGVDYIKNNTSIPIVYRMATVEDVKDASKPQRSRHLWKTSGAADASLQAGSKRSRKQRQDDVDRMDLDDDYADDGDAVDAMDEEDGARGRKERGGKKAKRRKNRMAVDGDGGGYVPVIGGHWGAGGGFVPGRGAFLPGGGVFIPGGGMFMPAGLPMQFPDAAGGRAAKGVLPALEESRPILDYTDLDGPDPAPPARSNGASKATISALGSGLQAASAVRKQSQPALVGSIGGVANGLNGSGAAGAG